MDLSFNNPEITVIVRGLCEEPREDLPTKIQALLASMEREMCLKVRITNLVRLKSRNKALDIVKVAFENLDKKKLVL